MDRHRLGLESVIWSWCGVRTLFRVQGVDLAAARGELRDDTQPADRRRRNLLYKAGLFRLLKSGHHLPLLTKGGEHFVTSMTLGALAQSAVYTSLWDLKDEVEMGHIELSRAANFLLVCPATADLLAKMAHGVADDLATTLLLTTDKPVVVAPAMNVRMWQHAATQPQCGAAETMGSESSIPTKARWRAGSSGPAACPSGRDCRMLGAEVLTKK